MFQKTIYHKGVFLLIKILNHLIKPPKLYRSFLRGFCSSSVILPCLPVMFSFQFTIECEHDNKLNYLDVTIIKGDNGKFSTTVYRKSTKSTEIIHYDVKIPFQYKLAAIRSYINRAIMICSNEKLLKQEMGFIIGTATKAGYKKYLVWNLYKKQIKKPDHIENAQKNRRIFTNTILFNRRHLSKLKEKQLKQIFISQSNLI